VKKFHRKRALFSGRKNARFGRKIGKNEETEDSACGSAEIEDDAGAEKGSKDFSLSIGAGEDLEEGRQNASRQRRDNTDGLTRILPTFGRTADQRR